MFFIQNAFWKINSNRKHPPEVAVTLVCFKKVALKLLLVLSHEYMVAEKHFSSYFDHSNFLPLA